MIKGYYFIREKWIMRGFLAGVEEYDETNSPANTIEASSRKIALNKVKKWIKDWIETWKENAEDNEYKFLRFKTDYKTFATLWIKKNDATDTFKLKVVPVEPKRKIKND